MSTDLPECGPWARDKLRALHDYLVPYTTILRKQKWCKELVYVDAFAGPGRHAVRNPISNRPNQQHTLTSWAGLSEDDERQEREYIDGSPRVALGLSKPFTKYVFVEMDEARVKMLEGLKAEYPDREIDIRSSDCMSYLRLFRNVQTWHDKRVLVFLDPFGANVDWEVLEILAKTRAVEVFLNFPAWMAIQRLMTQDPEHSLLREWSEHFDRYFGTHDWYDLMYSSEPVLFGEATVRKTGTTRGLIGWYRKRLQKIFGYVSDARVIRSPSNHPLYCLIHAGPNAKGSELANYVMNMGETI